jgi:hypothetical protein
MAAAGCQKDRHASIDVHTLYYCALATVVGFQSMFFWVFAKIYGMREGIVPQDPLFRSMMGIVSLEVGVMFGAALLIIGIGIGMYALGSWRATDFGELSTTHTMRFVIASGTAVLLGLQAIYSSFFMSLLEIRAMRRPVQELAGAGLLGLSCST